MSFDSDNPTHEVYIDGFPLLGEFIPFNTGVDDENTINSISGEFSTGKEYLEYLNENSRVLSFKTLLTDQLAEDGYEDILKSVVARAMKESVKVFFNNDVFMGKVKKFSVSFPPGAYREYTWLIVESEPFNPEVKKFNTFNFKQAKTPTKINFVLVTPSTELLLKCNPVYNCQKFKVACVIAWQKQLTADGFYGTKGYNIDGQYCTFTKSETERWQKHYKIKQTGVFDKATKAVLEKRFGKTDMTSDITKVLQKIDQMGR